MQSNGRSARVIVYSGTTSNYKEEHLKRLTQPERRARWKSIDPSDAEDNGPLISISHPNLLELNISNLSLDGAAEAIMNHVINL